eukprot:330044-Hanusia_phi.AAC.3
MKRRPSVKATSEPTALLLTSQCTSCLPLSRGPPVGAEGDTCNEGEGSICLELAHGLHHQLRIQGDQTSSRYLIAAARLKLEELKAKRRATLLQEHWTCATTSQLNKSPAAVVMPVLLQNSRSNKDLESLKLFLVGSSSSSRMSDGPRKITACVADRSSSWIMTLFMLEALCLASLACCGNKQIEVSAELLRQPSTSTS